MSTTKTIYIDLFLDTLAYPNYQEFIGVKEALEKVLYLIIQNI